jgi:hypothetical protein
MFCPKCGSQNGDGTKFCRGCGADVGNVLAAVDSKVPRPSEFSEKYIDLFGSGVRGLLTGFGFLIVAAAAFGISSRFSVIGLFAMAFCVFFLATGISRLVQARAIKQLLEPKKSVEPGTALSPGEREYIQPARSLFQTDDLVATPRSVTEHTTTRLEIDNDADTFGTPGKSSGK